MAFDDSLDPALWLPALQTAALGRGENRVLAEIDSTNAELRRMALSGAPHGSLCTADMQTAGRGRLGRTWHSPAGRGLWLSVLLRPALRPEDAPLITFCAALAMAQAVRETTELEAAIKWPNDLVLHGKKICGILLEMSAEPEKLHHVIVGTGLNVRAGSWPPELKHQATSLEEEGAAVRRRDVLAHYLAALEEALSRVEKDGFAGIYEEYAAHCCTLGSRVRVSGGIDLTGTAEAMDHTGALLVRTADGELHRVLAGDVSVRGVMGYV